MLWVQLPPEPLIVLVEQPGVLATLSRWRSWVQIPSGTFDVSPLLLGEGKGEGARYANSAKRPSSNLGDRLWVQLPPVLLENASAGHWQAQVAVTHPRSAVQVQLLPGALDGPFVYRRRTPAPQAGRMGSIPIRATWPSGGTGRHTTLRTSRLERHGSSTLPLVTARQECLAYCGVDWSLVPARSHKPFHAGSNPVSATILL